jgi:hypothetical protein
MEAEVDALERVAAWLREQVIGLELEVANLEGELRDFRARRGYALARLYARLDALDAAIARELYKRRPSDEVLRGRAEATHARARQSAERATAMREPPPPRPPASDELRRAFHRAARRMHPDLGAGDDAQERHRMMVLLNEAYEQRDLRAIEALLEDWEAQRLVTGLAEPSERARYAQHVLTRLRQSQERLSARLVALRGGSDYALLCALREDAAGGAARYDTLVADLLARIANARERLAALRGRTGGDE